jgi:hypothetical protein
MVAIQLSVQVAAVVFFLVTVMTESKAKFIADCNESRPKGVNCEQEANELTETTGKIELVAITAIPLFLQLCKYHFGNLCVIGHEIRRICADAYMVVRRFQVDLKEEMKDFGHIEFSTRGSVDYAASTYKYDPPLSSHPSVVMLPPEVSYAYPEVTCPDAESHGHV